MRPRSMNSTPWNQHKASHAFWIYKHVYYVHTMFYSSTYKTQLVPDYTSLPWAFHVRVMLLLLNATDMEYSQHCQFTLA